MIAELLKPDFLRQQGEEMIAVLKHHADKLTSADAEVQKAAAEKKIDAEALEQARAKLLSITADKYAKKGREAAWLPREPWLCILQTELERFYRDAKAVNDVTPAGLVGDLPDVTGESLKPEWIPTPAKGLIRQMEQYDLLGWGLSFGVAQAVQLVKGRHEFRKSAGNPLGIKDKARIVLCADWASGLPRARKVGRKMAAKLTDTEAKGRERHVINLGDTYYAGRGFEYEDRLSPYWPVEPWQSQEIGSWCLNGNHDMFTGGHGYYAMLDRDTRFSSQKGSSYFALENEHWLIVGLDTAWDVQDFRGELGGLEPPQGEWLRELRAARPDKRLMLLSHHQLFSSYEEDSPLMMERLTPLLQGSTPIDAWFWGHEHRCAVYKPYLNIDYPALIGHGGVPVFADSDPKPHLVWFEYKAHRPGGIIKKHAMLGFAVVDLDGRQAVVHYVNEDGDEHETHESKRRGEWKRRE